MRFCCADQREAAVANAWLNPCVQTSCRVALCMRVHGSVHLRLIVADIIVITTWSTHLVAADAYKQLCML